MIFQYILDENNNPVPCTDSNVAGALLMDVQRRRVARTKVGTLEVSTVFLVHDHGFGSEGPPVLWETMIFGLEDDDEYTERYRSYDEAVTGHERAVEWARAQSSKDEVPPHEGDLL